MVYEVGSEHPCLVTAWGGVQEGVATRCVSGAGRPSWVIAVPSGKRKGGKEVYVVVGVHYGEEDDYFVLL